MRDRRPQSMSDLLPTILAQRERDAAAALRVGPRAVMEEAIRLSAAGDHSAAARLLDRASARRTVRQPARRAYAVHESGGIPLRSQGATAEECRRYYNRQPAGQAARLFQMFKGFLQSVPGEQG